MPDGTIQPYKGRDAQAVIDQALQMYEEQGMEITESAPIIGVPARTIHRWLATNASDRWKEAQQARALSDYEQARKARKEASDALNNLIEQLDKDEIDEPAERNWRLTHRREVLKAADVQLDHQKWLLERLLSRLYGQKQTADVVISPSLTFVFASQDSGPVEKVIESTATFVQVQNSTPEISVSD